MRPQSSIMASQIYYVTGFDMFVDLGQKNLRL